VIDANVILANKTSLPSPLLVKPDMSLEDRAVKSTLLKGHWTLIQSGTTTESKLRSVRIINGILHGKDVNSRFQHVGSNSQPSSQPMDHQQSSHTQERNQEQSSWCLFSYNNPKSQNSNHAKLKF